MERDWSSVVKKTLSEIEFENIAKMTVVFYKISRNIPENTPENYVQPKQAENIAVQQSFIKIFDTVKSILDVRRVGQIDSSNTSKPRPIEVTSKNEFDRRVVMS